MNLIDVKSIRNTRKTPSSHWNIMELNHVIQTDYSHVKTDQVYQTQRCKLNTFLFFLENHFLWEEILFRIGCKKKLKEKLFWRRRKNCEKEKIKWKKNRQKIEKNVKTKQTWIHCNPDNCFGYFGVIDYNDISLFLSLFKVFLSIVNVRRQFSI